MLFKALKAIQEGFDIQHLKSYQRYLLKELLYQFYSLITLSLYMQL